MSDQVATEPANGKGHHSTPFPKRALRRSSGFVLSLRSQQGHLERARRPCERSLALLEEVVVTSDR